MHPSLGYTKRLINRIRISVGRRPLGVPGNS